MADITLSNEVKEIAAQVPIDEGYLVGLVEQFLSLAEKNGLNLAGNIVAGLDVNGPIVACDDVDLIPFKGSIPAMQHLMNQPGVEVTLMTGWDLTTMGFFRDERLGLPVGIVGEYGMAYELNGQTRHLYPYDETEATNFVSTVLGVAADDNLKVGFQGNVSPGAGALYVEGDTNGHLLNHCLVKDRRPSTETLYNSITAGGSNAELAGEKILFENKPENMKGLYDGLFKKHPLISVRVQKEEDGRLSIRIDENDKEGFTFKDVEAFGEKARAATKRDVLVYEDFGVDFMSPKVKEGNYSKDSGLRAYGKEAFGGDDFLPVALGDKNNDIPKDITKIIMCALKDSQADPTVRDMDGLAYLHPVDVRDFALALAEARRIASGG